MALDIRTVIVIGFLLMGLCLLVIFLLYFQYRSRYSGIQFWLAHYFLQLLAAVIILLQGWVPNWFFIMLPNILILTGFMLLLLGLRNFTGKRYYLLPNYVLLGTLVAFQVYFSLIQPELRWRHLIVNSGIVIFMAQAAWILWHGLTAEMQQTTRLARLGAAVFSVITLLRLIVYQLTGQADRDFFDKPATDTFFYILQLISFVFITFSLILMLNQRLINELRHVSLELARSEKKFSKAFHSNPIAACISSEETGIILEANAAFARIYGYAPGEILGRSSSAMGLWAREDDRRRVLETIKNRGRVENQEIPFRLKNGEIRIFLVSAERVDINNQPCLLWMGFDQTENKQAEKALRESEEKYRSLYENMAQGVIYQNDKGEVISINAAARRILNVAQAQLTGTQAIDQSVKAIRENGSAYPAEEHPSIVALRTGKPVRDAIMGIYNPQENSHRWIKINAVPQFRPRDARPYQVFVTFEDITEIKKAESILKESEEVFRYNFDLSPVGAAILSPQFRFMRANYELCRMLGYTSAEMADLTFMEVIQPPDTAQELELLRGLEKGTVARYQADRRYIRKDGSYIWGNTLIHAVRDKSGQVLYYIPRIIDISERKKMEEALKESEGKLRLILDSTAEAIFGVDLEGFCTFCNPACLQLLGYREEQELLGKHMHRTIHYLRPDGTPYPDKESKIYQALVHGQGTHADDEILVKADGTKIPVEYWSYPQIKDGQITGLVVTFVDITERKRVEARMVEIETLRKLDQAKSELLANVSHELRTPLASIKGFIETLLETDVTWTKEQEREFLTSANMEIDHLTVLIRDLLDMSRLEAGRMVLDRQPCSVEEVLRTSKNVIETLTAKHKMTYHLAPNLPDINVDKTRLVQVLTNLVENSVKFSPEGTEIVLAIQAGQDRVLFSVADQGAGMSPEVKEKVFDRFYQAKRKVSGKTRGTGLGLPICKGIIDSHGGSIQVESEEGRGAKFTFHIPL